MLSFLKNLLEGKEAVKQPHTKLSSQGAHHLWNTTNSKYIYLNNINIYMNLVHDKDFNYVLNGYIEAFENEINQLEEKMEKYSVKAPKPNSRNIKINQKLESFKDRDMAQTFHMLLRANVTTHVKTIKDTIFNDELRNLFINQLKNALEYIDDYTEFLKDKNWINYPPMYKNPSTEKEEVAGNEIFHLWEHLVYRYINIKQTKVYTSFVADKDFKVLLQKGIDTLTKQANKLEDKLLNYGVSLPTEYSKVTAVPKSKEVLGDEYIFNMILNGMQNATFLHGASIQEMIVNSELRNHFRQLLYKEIALVDNLIKYGKVKGWLYNPPKLKNT